MKPSPSELPMELVGVGVSDGDVDHMVECVIEEYLLLGWNDRQLMSLFTRPFFRMTHQVYLAKGEVHVRSLIEKVKARWKPGVA